MFKMPFSSDTPSTAKTRPGFHDPPESARATPSFAKSVSRDNLAQHSAIRAYNEREEYRDVANGSSLVVRSFDLPEDPSFWKDHNVQVIIRLRPLNNSEISLQGHNLCVRQESCQTITWTGQPESRFTFDLVADETVTQEKLFKVAGVPMVENCVGGYNSCMFAYGQTGSGKTHTMLGDIEGGTRRHSVNCGMTPRVFEYLFSRIQKEKEARRDDKLRFTCKCSFLEIYNEQILDLLNPSSNNLQIREDLKKGVHVENISEVEVTSARDVMQQLLEGAANRKVAATNMNRASSRSHSVFTCVIESTWESQGVTHHRFARLHMVDLAGSERQKSSGAEGERLKEATNINKSLSTLGLVIMNLVSISNGKAQHVPYRDSKLTFLLQDSLGGNSKTIIIANISPSNCSSLETLSTLKFAQRAKFIKNNAIVNEDASGDVLAMRMQIQHLKKEVSHLRSLLNGGATENQNSDQLPLGLLSSPGGFKWEALNGSFSPLTSDKRTSQKEYEVALVGAFRREKDKDLALQALAAENQAAMQLAKQREDEIQGLKMRLRFREAGIKRLESVASGKISAEMHLLKEKEEHLKEIEVLRAQVDRNQEVTRFAMENLRLKEEIRRLKSLCEEGEVERMNQQIITLQNKLLEALDWKLMHELSSSTNIQKTPDLLADSRNELNVLNLDKKCESPWQTSMNEENEFLRVQAIQNQSEIDSLQKKLKCSMEEKANLERNIKDLETELEAVKASQEPIEEKDTSQINLPSEEANDISKITFNDQLELKAMVDAIATASQREAEAHEIAITLTKENDELRAKIKILIEDNNKLIELYERAVAEANKTPVDSSVHDSNNKINFMPASAVSDEKGPETEKLEDLEHQLAELHEENEKLMTLYEKAMQERDDLKKKAEESNARDSNSETHDIPVSAADVQCTDTKKLEDLQQQLAELHEENEKLMNLYEKAMQAGDNLQKTAEESNAQDNNDTYQMPAGAASDEKGPEMKQLEEIENQLAELQEENEKIMTLYEKAMQERDDLKYKLSSVPNDNLAGGQGELECPEKLVEVDGGFYSQNTDLIVDESTGMEIDKPTLSDAVDAFEEPSTTTETAVQVDIKLNEHQNIVVVDSTADSSSIPAIQHVDESKVLESHNRCSPAKIVEEKNGNVRNEADNLEYVRAYIEIVMEEKIVLVRKELDKARTKISSTSETVSELEMLEKAVLEVEKLSSEIEATKSLMQLKQQEIGSLKHHFSEVQARRALIYHKIVALHVSLSSITSSVAYFEQREARASAQVEASISSLEQKKIILARLRVQADETNAKKGKLQEAEATSRNNHLVLKSKLEEENQRQERERVLFAIDNIEKPEIPPSQNSWKSGTKATELLKSEEDKIKLQNEIKQSREKLSVLKKEIEELNKRSQKFDHEIQAAHLEIEKGSKVVQETGLRLQNAVHEKEALLEMKENGKTEIDNLTAEYQQYIFEECMKEEELKIFAEDMHTMSMKFDELQTERTYYASKTAKLLDGNGTKTSILSDKMRQELSDVWNSILEAESFLD